MAQYTETEVKLNAAIKKAELDLEVGSLTGDEYLVESERIAEMHRELTRTVQARVAQQVS